MNKLIAILYALYVILYITGCSLKQSTDYELRIFMDRGSGEVTGYVEIDGKKHLIKGEYND